MQNQDKPAGVVRAVAGIDAAITALHHIAVREFFDDGTEHLNRFTVDPTLAGLERLSARLAAVPAPVTAVVEPTSMTWLALALAVERAGGQMEMIGVRHFARLRGAIMGNNKPDVIDSEVLTHAGEIFDPPPLVLAPPGQLALRRAVVRRAGAVIDGNRYWRRLLSLARWAFPGIPGPDHGRLPAGPVPGAAAREHLLGADQCVLADLGEFRAKIQTILDGAGPLREFARSTANEQSVLFLGRHVGYPGAWQIA